MINNNNPSISVNNFELLPFVPYKIVEALFMSKAKEAEDLFKCLKYSDYDCLSKPNLTLKEKREMLWSPDRKNWTQEQNFNIFLKPLISNSLDDSIQQTQLRIYQHNIMPESIYKAVVSFAFDFITEEKTSLIMSYEGFTIERTSYMECCMLSLMSGRDIGIGVNYFQFSRDFNRYSGSVLNISNSKSLYGRTLMMGLIYANVDKTEGCGLGD